MARTLQSISVNSGDTSNTFHVGIDDADGVPIDISGFDSRLYLASDSGILDRSNLPKTTDNLAFKVQLTLDETATLTNTKHLFWVVMTDTSMTPDYRVSKKVQFHITEGSA